MIHNPNKENIHLGPVMKSEEQLLGAICNLIDPKVIVEFGFYNGTSAKAMLESCDWDTKMYSYDILDRKEIAKIVDIRHTFIQKDMKLFEASDISNQNIDLVFFDASHELNDTIVAYERIKPLLTPKSIILVHDTGAYREEVFNPSQLDYIKKVENSIVYHCPDEHIFIQKLKDQGYNVINFTCLSKIRHGIAVLQREFDLKRTLQ